MPKKRATNSQVADHSDDNVRDAILRRLYEVHKNAKSPAKASIGIRELHSALKDSHGFKQQEVGSNLDYLVQKGWVGEVKIARSFTTKRGTQQNSEQVKYKISDIGIDKLQKASMYQRTPNQTGINITNVHGVTVVGDGNVVNTNFTEVSRVLNEIKTRIQESTQILDEQKLSAVADIDTLQAQLQKPEPNRSIIGMLWSGISTAATLAGCADGATKAAALLGTLMN